MLFLKGDKSALMEGDSSFVEAHIFLDDKFRFSRRKRLFLVHWATIS
jgi:hypothetical protein